MIATSSLILPKIDEIFARRSCTVNPIAEKGINFFKTVFQNVWFTIIVVNIEFSFP